MLTFDEILARRDAVAASADLTALRTRLGREVARLLERQPPIPALKGMLTVDGGVCPVDQGPLRFDPWSPDRHTCARCGAVASGPRHDQRWAWYQHLWLAERMAATAAVGVLQEDSAAVEWAVERVLEYADRYTDFPNRDNVLGPTRLFFSTYLESIWLTDYLAAAFLLREAGALDEAGLAAINALVEESANLIGEFDEGLSNRQTWHNAALCAAAVWFEDEELAQRAIEGPRGLVGHLVDGFRADGMWYEGENYHLFALRGLLVGSAWARLAGADFFEAEGTRAQLAAALLAPGRTALPDGTFPARKDSRFGISLAQPMYLELWEFGLARLLEQGDDAPAAALASWLGFLYQLPAQPAELFDSYLQEAGEAPPQHRQRADLSWWMLLEMAPMLPPATEAWRPDSTLLPEQGLAVLRHGDAYASLECGEYGGGHGHPDRLHLTLHAAGRHWLADPGTASYVSRDLFWYRSTLAHNAPRLDSASQPMKDARCGMFDAGDGWSWVRGVADRFTRTTVLGREHLVDVMEFAGEEPHLVELPWHPAGAVEILTPGQWVPDEIGGEFVAGAERFVPQGEGPIHWRAVLDGQTLAGWFDPTGDLLRASVPPHPGARERRTMLLRRATGRYVRWSSVIGWGQPAISAVSFATGEIRLETGAGAVVHRETTEGWEVEAGGSRTALRGPRRDLSLSGLDLPTAERVLHRHVPPVATAPHLVVPPALDGSLTGFLRTAPIHLDHDDNYRRSETPYPGPEALSAEGWFGWDETSLYVAVEVRHENPVFRPADAPPLLLDNEPDQIHSDGLQLYLRLPHRDHAGWIIVPDPTGSTLQVTPMAGSSGKATDLRGAWHRTGDGYRLTFAVTVPGWPPAPTEGETTLDLVVNEMRPGRLRRAGQLVWSGGGGWVYLRGDRQEAARMGQLRLA